MLFASQAPDWLPLLPDAVWSLLAAVGAALLTVLGTLYREHRRGTGSPYASLARRVEELERDGARRDRREQRLRELARRHTDWDQAILDELQRLDPSVAAAVGNPPPLYPTDDEQT